MKKYKILETGHVETYDTHQLQKKNPLIWNMSKVYKVQKGGSSLYFGNLRLLVESIIDLGVSETTLYHKNLKESPYFTRTGYSISCEFINHQTRKKE